ncbi:MAG: DUF11 domain-containing protein, partial [Dehalococcoidia bacterium]
GPGASRIFRGQGNVNQASGRIEISGVSATNGNFTTVTTYYIGFSDLTTSKSCNPPNQVVTQTTYSCTVTVTNSGGSSAVVAAGTALMLDVIVTGGGGTPQYRPPTFTPPANYACAGAVPGGDPNTFIVSCLNGIDDIIDPGQTRVFTIAGTVGQVIGNIFDQARVNPSCSTVTTPGAPNRGVRETNCGNNQSAGVGALVLAPDLTVQKNCSPTPQVVAGQFYGCQISVVNSGTANAVIPTNAVLLRDAITNTGNTWTITSITPAGGYACNATPVTVTNNATINCTRTGAPDTISPGQFRTFILGGLVTQTNGNIADTATADPNNNVPFESNNGNNTASATVQVIAPDLRATKSCTPVPKVVAGQIYKCTITVINDAAATGPAIIPAGAVLLTDFINDTVGNFNPPATPPAGYTCSNTPNGANTIINCVATAQDSIAPGQSRIFTTALKVTQTSGFITDFGVVDALSVIIEINEANNTSNTVTVEVIAPDMRAQKSCTPGTVANGAPLSCTILVVNDITATGPVLVAPGDVLVRDRITLPAGVRADLMSIAKPAGYTCTALPQSAIGATTFDATCTATANDSFNPNQARVFTFTYKITNSTAGQLTLSDMGTADPTNAIIEIKEDNNDSRAITSNVGTGAITYNPTATQTDLAITKVAFSDLAALNFGNVTFAVTVTNLGPALATGVAVTDTLGPLVTFVDATFVDTTGVTRTCARQSPTSPVITCAVGNLPKDQSVTVFLNVKPQQTGFLQNSATATNRSQVDPNTANDTTTQFVIVI